jgi:hypothetical protein
MVSARNPKPEGRSPKEGRNPKSESQLQIWPQWTTKGPDTRKIRSFFVFFVIIVVTAAFSAFGLRVSFGLRISALGFCPECFDTFVAF